MSSTKFTIVSILVMFLLINSCATLLSGYEDTIDLKNAPEDIRVYEKDGVELTISESRDTQFSYETRKYEPLFIKTISLRKNKEHTLVLKSGDAEKLITVYPKVGAGWLILDMVTGLFPVFIDAYTGNWHYFDDINASF
jgi:hypothetical protein